MMVIEFNEGYVLKEDLFPEIHDIDSVVFEGPTNMDKVAHKESTKLSTAAPLDGDKIIYPVDEEYSPPKVFGNTDNAIDDSKIYFQD